MYIAWLSCTLKLIWSSVNFSRFTSLHCHTTHTQQNGTTPTTLQAALSRFWVGWVIVSIYELLLGPFFLPNVTTVLANRLLYCILRLARPVLLFFFSWASTWMKRGVQPLDPTQNYTVSNRVSHVLTTHTNATFSIAVVFYTSDVASMY